MDAQVLSLGLDEWMDGWIPKAMNGVLVQLELKAGIQKELE